MYSRLPILIAAILCASIFAIYPGSAFCLSCAALDEVNPGQLFPGINQSQADNQYTSQESTRIRVLLIMFSLFAVMVIAVGGLQGVRTLITLAITAAAVLWILVPALLQGHDPITTTVIISSLVAIIALLGAGGFTVKTLAAVIGTAGGVISAAVMAVAGGEAARITVLELAEMQALAQLPGWVEIDPQGILFSGMIIGALGAVMDVGMSVASAVSEIKRANPRLGAAALIKSGMNVGRDIMSTMSNTLILAYAGGTIPVLLMLVAHDTPVGRVIGMDTISAELIRMVSGSMGLVLCIPITAFAAGILTSLHR